MIATDVKQKNLPNCPVSICSSMKSQRIAQSNNARSANSHRRL
jgi:hypothetical protein